MFSPRNGDKPIKNQKHCKINLFFFKLRCYSLEYLTIIHKSIHLLTTYLSSMILIRSIWLLERQTLEYLPWHERLMYLFCVQIRNQRAGEKYNRLYTAEKCKIYNVLHFFECLWHAKQELTNFILIFNSKIFLDFYFIN